MTEYSEHERAAYELGVEHTKNAASWACDGNMSQRDIERRLRMLDDGDPEVWDLLPARPNLSGEWADNPTPRSLFEDITGHDAHAESSWNYDAYQAVLEGLCEAYEAGVSDTFEAECERILRAEVTS